MLSGCPDALNRPLIALSRAMYEFYRDPRYSQPERLHEYEERKALHLQFCRSFSVGTIRGALLREALGLSLTSNDGDGSLDWHWNMLDWGYPPGWYSEEDPMVKVISQIAGEKQFSTETAVIYGENGEVDDPPSLADEVEYDSVKFEETTHKFTPKRWAKYSTDLFSSDLLPVYSGRRLPPIGGEAKQIDTTQAKTTIPPPWRRPGAFDAFGPSGWQNFIKHVDTHYPVQSSVLNTSEAIDNTHGDSEEVDDGGSDMDMNVSD
ncbi:hypothetical protein M422DRAFT_252321 [Sphaerobolus stellatus SS14]|uniref:Uncharacterized protein n=1 Tax=Sphaerobolus stellatus (strain SS14) TaxID=990650 RepID=A0A0C9VZ16_SPHS4|nr:hypothetical protein M422DRAFT_252321 [Sphaerobolus stellatus SS14]